MSNETYNFSLSTKKPQKAAGRISCKKVGRYFYRIVRKFFRPIQSLNMRHGMGKEMVQFQEDFQQDLLESVRKMKPANAG